jgi:DNA-binding HxlR family transcriptional regulator
MGTKVAMAQRRSHCPIACTLDLVGDRWTLVVLRDLFFFGKTRYDEFLRSPEGIATNILADRLRRLEELGFVERTASESHRGRSTYALTALGMTLLPVLRAIREWGLANVDGTRLPPGTAVPVADPASISRPSSSGRKRTRT